MHADMGVKLLIITLALILPLNMQAQKGRKAKQKEKTPEELRIERMTEATKAVMFIDSVIVDKDDFLSAYVLSDETGSLRAVSPYLTMYINEMGNKRYYASGDITTVLMTSDLLGNEWSEGEELKGITDSTITYPNYPFVMADGTTMYFAARGSESIGGYDIFATRFNASLGRYYKPENIGMPFNSTANDYMYAIDEEYGIGYFATDRNQPEGKVCVYIFRAKEIYDTYSSNNYTTEQIAAFARISAIADTQGDKEQFAEAVNDLERLRTSTNKETDDAEMTFVINDSKTYHSYRDFKDKENYYKFKQLQTLRKRLESLNESIDTARERYAVAAGNAKRTIGEKILRAEQEQEQLVLQIAQMEKEIRNSEAKDLN